MTREKNDLVAATAKLLQVVPADQQEAMLQFVMASFRAGLVEVRADLSSHQVAARVAEHVAAIRARLR